MSDDHRHVLQRFVAGLDVDADELATAIVTEALDHEIVDTALVQGLQHPEPIARVRAARRVGRMPEVGVRVLAHLRVVAFDDPDPRAREAAAAALEAHEPAPVPSPSRARRVLASIAFEPATGRGGPETYAFGPEVRAGHEDVGAKLTSSPEGPTLTVSGLPAGFVGTSPVLVTGGEELARATVPVTPGGEVLFRFAPAPLSEVASRLERAVVVVYAD